MTDPVRERARNLLSWLYKSPESITPTLDERSDVHDAIAALRDALDALVPKKREACGHESRTGLGNPRVWFCDGCGAVIVEVDDPKGPVSDGSQRWREEIIGRVNPDLAQKWGPPMRDPAPDAVPASMAFRDAFKAAVVPPGCDHASWVNGFCNGWLAAERAAKGGAS